MANSRELCRTLVSFRTSRRLINACWICMYVHRWGTVWPPPLLCRSQPFPSAQTSACRAVGCRIGEAGGGGAVVLGELDVARVHPECKMQPTGARGDWEPSSRQRRPPTSGGGSESASHLMDEVHQARINWGFGCMWNKTQRGQRNESVPLPVISRH